MSCNIDKNYRLEAVSATFGKEAVTTITPVVGKTGGEYFSISSPTVDYYMYITVNGSGADPAPAGKTSLGPAILPTSYTVANAVDAIITAVESTAKFYATEATDGLSLCLTALVPGVAKTAPGAGTSGFTIAEDTAGFSVDLGQTADGIEISFEPTLFDVTANQTGTSVNDQIIQGFNISVSMGLIQLTTDKWQKVVGAGFGNVKTPSGGTEVVGFGTAKNFTSSFDYAGRLTLHPVRLASNVLTDDITIWKCVPSAESINYSGTDLQTMALTFNSLIDSNKSINVNLMVRGDSTQYIK